MMNLAIRSLTNSNSTPFLTLSTLTAVKSDMIVVDAMTYDEIGDNLSRHFHVLVEYKKTAMDVKSTRRAPVLMYSLNHYLGDDGGHNISSEDLHYSEDIACSLDSISAHDELHKMPEACQFTLEKAIKKLIYYQQNR